MYVCMYVCMCVCLSLCQSLSLSLSLSLSGMYARYVCMQARMYVCMHVQATFEQKADLFSSLATLVPSLQSRDVNPWYCHMISAWGLARWRLQSLTLRAKRSNLGKTMQFLHRTEFSEDRHDKNLLHVPAFVPPESDRVLESTSSSDSDKRMSQTSLSSPLRPPTGEIQAPPPLKREHGRQKHFLAPDPSPPDTDSRSVSGNSNASLASPAGALSPTSRPRMAKALTPKRSKRSKQMTGDRNVEGGGGLGGLFKDLQEVDLLRNLTSAAKTFAGV